jgi:hypothetical protein
MHPMHNPPRVMAHTQAARERWDAPGEQTKSSPGHELPTKTLWRKEIDHG